MGSTLLYASEKERLAHQRSIDTLALKTGVPISRITHIYEEILDEFKHRAKVMDFLPILVSKEVKHILMESGNLRKRRS